MRHLASLLLLLLAAPALAQTRSPVTIGVSEGADRYRNYGPLEAQLRTSTAFAYSFKRFDTPDDLVVALREKRVDLALLGPINYVRAHSAFGAVPIVTDGKSYRGMVIVTTGSQVQVLTDLTGKRIAFSYNQSMSGHLLPLLRLSRVGIRPPGIVEGCAKRPAGATCYDFLGTHNAVADAVLAGTYDAGALIDEVAQRTKGVRIIDSSDPFPAVPLCARKDAPPALLEDVRRLLLTYSAPAGSASHPFVSGAKLVTDSDFNQVRFLAKVVLGETYH